MERELKSSLLAKILRQTIQSKIEASYINEEVHGLGLEQVTSLIGERRGYRSVLNLLPEE